MPFRTRPVLLSAAMALLLVSSSSAVLAANPEPFGFCLDGECGVSPIDREDAEVVAAATEGFIFTDETDPPGLVVCLEGHETCSVRSDELSIADIELVHDGRIVYGRVDGDAAGTWATTQLRTILICNTPGTKALRQPVKKTSDTAFIERDSAGRLVTTSTTEGSRPTTMVRIAPGLYGARDSYKQGKNRVEITSYMGMLSDDEAQGTSTMRFTTRINGSKATCSSDRNYDMVRIGPAPEIEIEHAIAGPDGGPGTDEASAEAGDDPGSDEPAEPDGPEMTFTEDEVDGSTE